MQWNGLFAAELAAAIVSIFGLLVAVWMLPETKGRALRNSARFQACPAVAPQAVKGNDGRKLVPDLILV
jgi:hypothetical protein